MVNPTYPENGGGDPIMCSSFKNKLFQVLNKS